MKVNENITITLGQMSPADVWQEKDRWSELEQSSLQEWEKMEPDEKEVLINLVQRALDRLSDRAVEWVPATIKIEQGKYIDVQMRILMTDLDLEVAAGREITERQIREAAAATRAFLEESNGTEPGS